MFFKTSKKMILFFFSHFFGDTLHFTKLPTKKTRLGNKKKKEQTNTHTVPKKGKKRKEGEKTKEIQYCKKKRKKIQWRQRIII